MGFADALGVLGGSSDAQMPPAAPAVSQGNDGRVRINIYGTESASPKDGMPSSWSRALDILSSDAKTPLTKQERQVGTGESFLTGVKSGLSANFSDEISGLAAAGRTMLPDAINPDRPAPEGQSLSDVLSRAGRTAVQALSNTPLGAAASAAVGAGRMGYEALAGGDTGTQAYEQARDAERENQRLAAGQHPIANLAGNVTGALMIPVPGGAMASGASLPVRMGAGAALGAGYGAAYGAGEGAGAADRVNKAGAGALFGGVGGAVAPALVSGISAASKGIAKGVGKVLGNPIDTIRAGMNPDAEAARRIGQSVMADYATGAPGMSGADLMAARSTGQPTSIIDIGGENTRALARSAANTSPAARAALEDMATDRFATQSDRVSNFVRSLVPTGGNATRTQEAIDVAERAANKPAYARAYAAGDRSINSPELERLMGSPDVVAAMKDAAQKGKSRAIADGFGAFNPGVKVTDDGRVIFNKGPSGAPTYPNLQFWDYTYRSLRDAGQAAFRAGRNDEGSYLSNIAKQMRSELDTLVPEYGNARGVASKFFQAENALEAGQKFVSMRGSIEEARIAHAKMTPAQKALFAEGYVSDLADKVSKIADNRSVVIDKIFNSPDGRARTELALGKGRASELEAFLRRENMMDLARKAMGNSTTARQLMEMGLAGGIGAAAGGATEAALNGKIPDLKTALAAAVVGGAAGIGRKVNFKVAQRVGEMLASDDPKVLMTALKMAKTNPDMGLALRRAETMLEKLVGQHANAGAPLLPRIPASRAEEQQQQ